MLFSKLALLLLPATGALARSFSDVQPSDNQRLKPRLFLPVTTTETDYATTVIQTSTQVSTQTVTKSVTQSVTATVTATVTSTSTIARTTSTAISTLTSTAQASTVTSILTNTFTSTVQPAIVTSTAIVTSAVTNNVILTATSLVTSTLQANAITVTATSTLSPSTVFSTITALASTATVTTTQTSTLNYTVTSPATTITVTNQTTVTAPASTVTATATNNYTSILTVLPSTATVTAFATTTINATVTALASTTVSTVTLTLNGTTTTVTVQATATSSSVSSALASSSTATTSTAAYATLGCYSDSVSNRSLNVTGTGESIELCATYCSSYQYFGVEYGSRCYCGNTLTASTLPNSSCNVACSLNSNEVCGGSNALNVYQNTNYVASTASSTPAASASASTSTSSLSLLAGTRAIGCYADNTVSRSLSILAYSNSANTPSTCASTCRSLGYKFSGTEYSTQRYCGNYLLNSAAPSTGLASSGCSMTCSGDSSQICGGSSRLNIIQDDQWSQSFFTVTQTGSWTFTDCVVDSTSSRALATSVTVSSNTPEKCLAACSTAGFKYCGMEYAGECWGSNTVPTAASAPFIGGIDPIARGCSMPCSVNSTVACGASNRLNLYTNLGSSVTSVSPSVLQ